MHTRKKAWCALLALLMLLSLAPEPSRAAGTVIFTAANEKIYPLTDETMPFWSNGTVYVPNTALVDNDFNIQYSRSRKNATVVLYQMRNGLIFDLNAGTAEARGGQSFSAQTVVRGDIVFFPLDLLCRFFDLEYSYTRVTYGYLLRIKNDSVSLSDAVFIDAAGPAFAQRYAQYERAKEPSETQPNAQAETQQPQQPQAERTVYLAVEASDAALSELLLSRLSSHSAAFVFAPEALSSCGDLLRRLAAGGGTVALRIDASSGVDETLHRIREANNALWTAASVKTRLVLFDGADADTLRAAEAAGYCPLHFGPDYREGLPSVSRMCSQIFAAADRSGGSCCVFLGTDSAALDVLSALLAGLSEGNCTPARLNEAVLQSLANSQNV